MAASATAASAAGDSQRDDAGCATTAAAADGCSQRNDASTTAERTSFSYSTFAIAVKQYDDGSASR